MKYTNLEKLPKAVRNAILNDGYDPGPMTDITVSKAIDSPRVAALSKRYWKTIERDARREVPSLIGKALHALLEKHGEGIVEERLYTVVHGMMLSGAIDLQQEVNGAYKIIDYKTWSTASAKVSLKKAEAQLNFYAFLMRSNGKKVSGLEIICIYKDWSESKAEYNQTDYPQFPIEVFPLTMWPEEECEEYVKTRVMAHKLAMGAKEDDLPLCTDDDRWIREVKWAVTLPGRKLPKLFLDEVEAKNFASEKGGEVTRRPGRAIRCEKNYCGVAQVCSQYQREINERSQ